MKMILEIYSLIILDLIGIPDYGQGMCWILLEYYSHNLHTMTKILIPNVLGFSKQFSFTIFSVIFFLTPQISWNRIYHERQRAWEGPNWKAYDILSTQTQYSILNTQTKFLLLSPLSFVFERFLLPGDGFRNPGTLGIKGSLCFF